MAKRYVERKAYALKFLGGKCVVCGSKKSLQFDHKKRRTTRDFVVLKRLAGVATEKFVRELAKCQLLCVACHNEKTQKELGRKVAKGTHGSLSAYRYCGPPKCDACKAAKRAYYARKRRVAKAGFATDS